MKRNKSSLSGILIVAAMFLAPLCLNAQTANSLYFLDRTPFHNQWNPAMTPSNSGIGLLNSSFGMTLRSDLALEDLITPSPSGGKPITFLHPDANKEAFLGKLGDVSNFGFGMSMDLFNLGLKFGKVYVTLHSSMHNDINMGVPKDFFKLIMLGTEGTTGPMQLGKLSIGATTYLKSGAGFSLKLGEKVSVGINANYLAGLADMHLGFDQFDVESNGSKLNVTTKGKLQMTAPEAIRFNYDQEGKFDGIHVDDNYGDDLSSDPMGNLPVAGGGVSLDLGVTAKPLDFLTVSAAVMDLGSIKWKKSCISEATSDNTFTYEGSDLNNGSANVTDGLTDIMDLKENNNVKEYTTKLTTKVNVGVEAFLPNKKISLGLLSQTGLADNGAGYQDFMASLNMKPGKMLQTALSYSLLHGEMSSFGAAVNLKLFIFNFYAAADYIPLKVNPQFMPVKNSYFNYQGGVNIMF